jgi:hypothetical protein
VSSDGRQPVAAKGVPMSSCLTLEGRDDRPVTGRALGPPGPRTITLERRVSAWKSPASGGKWDRILEAALGRR